MAGPSLKNLAKRIFRPGIHLIQFIEFRLNCKGRSTFGIQVQVYKMVSHRKVCQLMVRSSNVLCEVCKPIQSFNCWKIFESIFRPSTFERFAWAVRKVTRLKGEFSILVIEDERRWRVRRISAKMTLCSLKNFKRRGRSGQLLRSYGCFVSTDT